MFFYCLCLDSDSNVLRVSCFTKTCSYSNLASLANLSQTVFSASENKTQLLPPANAHIPPEPETAEDQTTTNAHIPNVNHLTTDHAHSPPGDDITVQYECPILKEIDGAITIPLLPQLPLLPPSSVSML